MLVLGGAVHPVLLLQHLYLQMLLMLLLTTAGFFLSLALSYDAALTIGLLLYAASGFLSSASLLLHEFAGPAGRALLLLLNLLVPQLVLFDLSDKVVHGELWPPLAPGVLLALTAYALVYTAAFAAAAAFLFRRRPL